MFHTLDRIHSQKQNPDRQLNKYLHFFRPDWLGRCKR